MGKPYLYVLVSTHQTQEETATGCCCVVTLIIIIIKIGKYNVSVEVVKNDIINNNLLCQ